MRVTNFTKQISFIFYAVENFLPYGFTELMKTIGKDGRFLTFSNKIGEGISTRSPTLVKQLDAGFDLVGFILNGFKPVCGNKRSPLDFFQVADFGTAVIKQQPVFGPTGKHSVRFIRAFGDKIINQNSDVPAFSANKQGILFLRLESGIGAGYQALSRRFLVAGGSINLTGKKKVFQQLGFKGARKLSGI